MIAAVSNLSGVVIAAIVAALMVAVLVYAYRTEEGPPCA